MTNPTRLSLEALLQLGDPLDVSDARQASRLLAENRRTAERTYEEAVACAAEAENIYRKEFAKAFASAEGAATKREVEAADNTADFKRDWEIKKGLVKSCLLRLDGIEGERSLLKSLIDWSLRMEMTNG